MPDLLLELFSEEIPARMQTQAAKDLERLVVGALSDRGLLFEGAKSFAGPRRLTLAIAGLPAKQPDVSEERKGPRVGAPEKAMEGFLRSAGVTLDQCQKQSDGKGEFYVAVIARKGRATAEVLAEVLPEAFAKLPWPKSMRWRPGEVVRWVRPLHSILCVFDGAVVPFEFAGVKSGNETRGHRFLSSGTIDVRDFEEYQDNLFAAHVILDAAERKAIILRDAREKAAEQGLELIEDEGLLEEVAGLNEWPTVLIGKIEDQFMDVPAEILQTSMRTHQKYFSLRSPHESSGTVQHSVANKFLFVSNMTAPDDGREVVAGNERVLRARLSDAKFFWEHDRKRTLESRVEDLKSIVFHAKLGTQYERVQRIEILAGDVAAAIGMIDADVEKVRRAARLSKADLTTGIVGEFPELQGVMGLYYAILDGEDVEVANAIAGHYHPRDRSDSPPDSLIDAVVGYADRLDGLVGFFVAGERATGSADPFALRRMAMGLLRIIFRWQIDLPLPYTLAMLAAFMHGQAVKRTDEKALQSLREIISSYPGPGRNDLIEFQVAASRDKRFQEYSAQAWQLATEIFAFLIDRMKAVYRDGGMPHDLVDAGVAVAGGRLKLLDWRITALRDFLKSDDGANLLVAYRRAANILKIEEKKDKASYDGEPDPDAFVLPEEKALFVELATAGELVRAEIGRERFVEAMGVMSRLRKPVDAFFDKVTVNDKDAALRKNRLLLLSRLRATLHLAADFSKIEG